jgi:hypothetical protein
MVTSTLDCRLTFRMWMWTYIAIAVGGTYECWARYGLTNLI